MGAFEFVVIFLITVAIILFCGLVYFILKGLQRIVSWQHSQWKELRGIYVNAAHIDVSIEKIYDNICADKDIKSNKDSSDEGFISVQPSKPA